MEKDSIIIDEKAIATLMRNYVINITKNLDLQPSVFSNTRDIDKVSKYFDGHISTCKINEADSEILQKDNLSFEMVSINEVKIVVFKLK